MNEDKKESKNFYSSNTSIANGRALEKAVSVVPSRLKRRNESVLDDDGEGEPDFLKDVIKAAAHNIRASDEQICNEQLSVSKINSTKEDGKVITESNVLKDRLGVENDGYKNEVPETELNRNATRLQPLGVTFINAPGRHSIDDSGSIGEQDDEISRRKSEIAIEAELVGSNNGRFDVEQAVVQPAQVAQAEPIDAKVYTYEQENSIVQKKWFLHVVCVTVTVIVLALVATTIFAFLTNNNTQNDAGGNAATQQQQNETAGQNTIEENGALDPYNLKNYHIVTQHALLIEARMNCSNVVNEQSPGSLLIIECGASNPDNEKSALEVKLASDNIKCTQNEPRRVECFANLSKSVTTQFTIFFLCGTNYTGSSLNQTTQHAYASVQTFPLIGINCQSDPVISIGPARLCRNDTAGEERPLAFQPAISSQDSCIRSQYSTKPNKWAFCQGGASCRNNQYPCSENITINDFIVNDYIDDGMCENLPEEVQDIFQALNVPGTA